MGCPLAARKVKDQRESGFNDVLHLFIRVHNDPYWVQLQYAYVCGVCVGSCACVCVCDRVCVCVCVCVRYRGVCALITAAVTH